MCSGMRDVKGVMLDCMKLSRVKLDDMNATERVKRATSLE